MKKTWKIPVSWAVMGVAKIEADTLEEAIEIATNDKSIPLPTDCEYIDGSWTVDADDIGLVRNCYNNGQTDSEDVAGKWICTDPDCLQYGKQVSEKEFEYIECREFPDNQFVVCGMTIDLEDYSLFEVNDYVSGYYDSVLELATSVAARYGDQAKDIDTINCEFYRICAECIFEQQDLLEMSFTSKFDTFEEAENFVSNYLTEHA